MMSLSLLSLTSWPTQVSKLPTSLSRLLEESARYLEGGHARGQQQLNQRIEKVLEGLKESRSAKEEEGRSSKEQLDRLQQVVEEISRQVEVQAVVTGKVELVQNRLVTEVGELRREVGRSGEQGARLQEELGKKERRLQEQQHMRDRRQLERDQAAERNRRQEQFVAQRSTRQSASTVERVETLPRLAPLPWQGTRPMMDRWVSFSHCLLIVLMSQPLSRRLLLAKPTFTTDRRDRDQRVPTLALDSSDEDDSIVFMKAKKEVKDFDVFEVDSD